MAEAKFRDAVQGKEGAIGKCGATHEQASTVAPSSFQEVFSGMQQQLGNQAVQRMLREHVLQAKLTINQPGDEYEQEADRVADQVMRMELSTAASRPEASDRQDLLLQRKCAACEEEESVQRKPDDGATDTAPAFVNEVLDSPGQPLDEATRAFFEPRFGHDFSKVRVHTDGRAAESARAVNALAFATGHHIVFGDGRYEPSTGVGSRLLAHELAHVLQQTDTGLHRNLMVSQPGDSSEREAETMAQAAMQPGDLIGPRQGSSLTVARSAPRVQRVTVPLEGWGSGTITKDKSRMEIQPSATLWINGVAAARKTFSGDQRETVTMPLGTTGILQIAASITVTQNNAWLTFDAKNSWNLRYGWRISADNGGNLRISQPTRDEWGGGTGDAPWSVQADPTQGDRSVGVAVSLGSVVSKSSGNEWSLTGALGGKFTPFGVGVDIQGGGGYAHNWSTTIGSTLVAGRGFVVDIDVPAPPGPRTTLQSYEFYFETGQASLGSNPGNREDENIRLTGLLRSLDVDNNGGVGLSGEVDGYASPVGDRDKNLKLSERRADLIMDRVKALLPRADFKARAWGEDLWRSEGVPKVDDSQKHRVVVLRVRRKGE